MFAKGYWQTTKISTGMQRVITGKYFSVQYIVSYRDIHAYVYNPVLVYCRELALGTVSLTGDRAKGDDSKHDSHYTINIRTLKIHSTCYAL